MPTDWTPSGSTCGTTTAAEAGLADGAAACAAVAGDRVSERKGGGRDGGPLHDHHGPVITAAVSSATGHPGSVHPPETALLHPPETGSSPLPRQPSPSERRRGSPRSCGRAPAEPGYVIDGRVQAQAHVPDQVSVDAAVDGGVCADLRDEIGPKAGPARSSSTPVLLVPAALVARGRAPPDPADGHRPARPGRWT